MLARTFAWIWREQVLHFKLRLFWLWRLMSRSGVCFDCPEIVSAADRLCSKQDSAKAGFRIQLLLTETSRTQESALGAKVCPHLDKLVRMRWNSLVLYQWVRTRRRAVTPLLPPSFNLVLVKTGVVKFLNFNADFACLLFGFALIRRFIAIVRWQVFDADLHVNS